MKNKKYIVIAAILAALSLGISTNADTSSSLLQMDVQRASMADTVDVTFYTTGDLSNSVVTRKSNNRYVVLLPNIHSSSSVTPGIGGVKDLITDVEVKHVDDGIGGYTKVTFGTTKPINIKTHMKKTNPLTQAQKDYRAIIAKNNVQNISTEQLTKTPQTTPVQPAVQKTTTQQAVNVSTQTTSDTSKQIKSVIDNAKKINSSTKTTQQKPTTTEKPKTIETKKVITAENAKIAEQPTLKVEQKPEVKPQPQQKPVQKPVSALEKIKSTAVSAIQEYTPKMKFDENGKRIIDLEPRVSHDIFTIKAAPSLEKKQVETVANAKSSNVETSALNVSVEQSKESNKSWMMIAGGAILFLGALILVFDAIAHANKKGESRLQSFFKLSSQNQMKRRKKEYDDIVNDNELSWQDKYKLYIEKEEQIRPKQNNTNGMSFVTDLSGKRKAISSIMDLDKVESTVANLEHTYNNTPSMNSSEDVSGGVKSEDDAITNKINQIKLKTFSKNKVINETNRSLNQDDKKVSRNKEFKEGRFVKLKNSPLNVTRRKTTVGNFDASDLINTGSKYLMNNGEMKMTKEHENYVLSSLDEYLSILDSEERTSTRTSVAESMSQMKSSSIAMSRSGVTNPIARASNPMAKSEPTPYMNGLIVKSGYNINSEKGFYLVNIDGASALVGRIKDSLFVLKKFDSVIDKPLQVRLDHDNVYIVKAGGYKCLVDVTKDKMGTLIEI